MVRLALRHGCIGGVRINVDAERNRVVAAAVDVCLPVSIVLMAKVVSVAASDEGKVHA